jgi:hypothetical protein
MSRRKIDRRALAELLDVDEAFVTELESHQIVVCDREGMFDGYAVERVRVSWTMHRSLGVNMEGLEVALDLLDRYHRERDRVNRLLEIIEELRARERGR